MRKGIVILIDVVAAKGYIEDENEQDIPFMLNTQHQTIKVGDLVTFEIELADQGLLATNILRYKPEITETIIKNDSNQSRSTIYISKEVPE